MKRVGYNGWITADVFPQRHDPVDIMGRTFAWMDRMIALADRLDADRLFAAMNDPEAVLDTLDYVRDAVLGV